MEKWTFPKEDAGQDALLLLVGAEGHQGRADAVQREERERHPGPVGLLHEDHLVDRPPSPAPVLHGPAQPEPAVLAHPTDVMGVGRLLAFRTLHLVHEADEVVAQLVLELLLFRRQSELHLFLRWWTIAVTTGSTRRPGAFFSLIGHGPRRRSSQCNTR